MVKYSTLMAAIALAVPACGAPLKQDTERAESSNRPVADQPEKNVTDDDRAVSRHYRTLDEYLAFLKSRSTIDGAWYREIQPSVYRLETGNYRPLDGDEQKRVFTREELMRKFGFTR